MFDNYTCLVPEKNASCIFNGQEDDCFENKQRKQLKIDVTIFYIRFFVTNKFKPQHTTKK